MTKHFDTVVLAAGDFPQHRVAADLLDHPNVVCCDGAAEAFIASGRTPLAVVGDCDSLSEELKARLDGETRLVQIADQESNDLTKAVSYICHKPLPCGCSSFCRTEVLPPWGHKRLAIIGATGKREDHTLGNISLLIDYMRMGIDVTMVTDHGIFIPCHGTRSFTSDDAWWLAALGLDSILHGELSIFNFSCTRLEGDGLDYPLRPFSSWWQGTLNYISAPTVTITADGDYLLYFSFSFRN